MTRVLATNESESATLPVFAEPFPSVQHELVTYPETFEINTRAVRAIISLANGLTDIWFNERPILHAGHLQDAQGSEWICTPLGVERCLHIADSVVTERVIAAPDVPALLVEWQADRDVTFDIGWQYSEGDHGVVMFNKTVDVVASESAETCSLHARIPVRADSPARMLVTAAIHDLASMYPSAWVRAQKTALQRRQFDALRLDTPDPSINHAWQWAMHHLAGTDDVDSGDTVDLPASIAMDSWQPTMPVSNRASASQLVAGFFEHVLQVAPDTRRERLSVRIKLPDDWPRAGFHNIRLGDALVDVSIENGPESVTVRANQMNGAYPIRLILETVLTFRPSRSFVDGEFADLNVREVSTCFVVPVQLMLDHERIVEFRKA